MLNLLKILEKAVFKLLYYIVSFFIFIGDLIKLFFYQFFNFIVKILNIFGYFGKIIILFIYKSLKITLSKVFLFFQKIYLKIKKELKIILNLFKIKFVFTKKSTVKIKNYTDLKVKKSLRIKLFFPNELFNKIKFFIFGSIFSLLVLLIIQGYYFVKSLPSPENIGKINYPLSTHIYDRNGILLYEIYREQNRTPVSLKDLPKYLIEATIAIEDKDFYRHNGVSIYSGILRAIKENLLNKKFQGGSTITQQLVKSALLTNERTIERKIKEIILALWTERIYTKDQILEMYFNQVPYGGATYGIEEAAKTYFGKKAKDLTIEEAVFLAGLPQAPSTYSPFINPQLAYKRRDEVVLAMVNLGYLSKEKANVIKKTSINILPPNTYIKAPHFVFYVKNQLENYFGIRQVEEGGLRVKTTLDINIQEEVERILKEEIERNQYLNITNGAVLVTRPNTGEILAMVGSVDYFLQPWGAYNVSTALRQPGSSLKPLLYALALEKGYTAATLIDDVPVSFKLEDGTYYKPVNYDGKFHGKVPLRYALANSYNIPAVRLISDIGVNNYIDFAEKLGIKTWFDRSRYGLSLSLGGGEVKMVDMAEAFGVLANLGYKVNLNYQLLISDSANRILKEISPFKIKVLDKGVAYIINDILSDSYARTWAFGPNSYLEVPGYKVAVKTGTTNDKRDNWTVGYTPEFLVIVWVGNNDNSPMNPYLTSGITGAAPIWNRVMNYLLKNYSQKENYWYEKPENVVEKYCYFGRKEYFIKATENKVYCQQNFLITPTLMP